MNKTQPEPSSASNSQNDKGIDKIDARILRVLQRDGRISNPESGTEERLSRALAWSLIAPDTLRDVAHLDGLERWVAAFPVDFPQRRGYC